MPKADVSVIYLTSDMTGASGINETVGSLINAIDAMRTGFGTVTLSSLVVSGDVATAIVSTGHNLAMIGTTGPVVEISGVTGALTALNDRWRVASVTNSTTFTFVTDGIANGTAGGTISCKRAGMKLGKAFSGTNKAAYRFDAPQSTRLYCRVDDTPTNTNTTPALCTMYESMTDVDTGTAAATTIGCHKSSSPATGNKPWALYADDKIFYLFIDNYATYWMSRLFFGDFISVVSNDAYNCLIHGVPSNSYNSAITATGLVPNAQIARDYTQTGAAIAFHKQAHMAWASGNSNAGYFLTYPNPSDNKLYVAPVYIVSSSGANVRGIEPGLYHCLHNHASFTQGQAFTNVEGLTNKTLVCQKIYNSGGFMLDITGPWR